MAQFRYRAATPTGDLRAGVVDGDDLTDALKRLRGQGLTPIEAVEAPARTVATARKAGAKARKAATTAVSELAVLLGAGLSLDRAMAVVTDNLAQPAARAAFATMHKAVKEGVPLSRAMAAAEGLFPPAAPAMAEAGEANGRLDTALARLADTLERARLLRETIVSAMIYPALLLTIATGVILVMLLVVVPQFEALIASQGGDVPATTRAVMGASRLVRENGLTGLLLLAIGGLALRHALKRPAARLAFDRATLKAPLIGPIVTAAETARFARVLGSLVEGGVPVPAALAIARRSVSNAPMAAAIGRVATGLKEGGGLTGPLAATGLFPKLAISFMRTGEETARLGPMLERLADVLDREVRVAIARAIGVLTPAITVVIGVVIALVIASLMSAILGFNELATGG